MRLVMLYTFWDGCNYSYAKVLPLISESPEQALSEFETAYRRAKKSLKPFKFAGVQHYEWDFEYNDKYYAPEFLTIDQWFKQVEG